MARDVIELCRELAIKQASFIGNSMGGYILQSLAYQNPGLINKGIISNSTMIAHTCFHYYIKAQYELLKAKAPLDAIVKATSSWAYGYDFLSKPGTIQRLIKVALKHSFPFSLKGYVGQYKALESFDSRSWAHKITTPMLVIGSDEDLIFSEAKVKELANKIPMAKYYGFKGVGHLPHVEKPDEFIQVVRDFL